MDIPGNPAWQGIGVWVAVVALILNFVQNKARNRKILTYKVMLSVPVDEVAENKVTIRYAGRAIKDAHFVVIQVLNDCGLRK